MLKRLEGADRDAELLARLQVLDGHRERLAHRADRLGRQRGDRLVDRALDDRQAALPSGPRTFSGSTRTLGEADLRGAAPILRRIAAAGHARRVAVDEKQPDSVAVAPSARDPGRDDQRIRAVAVDDEPLLAVENVGCRRPCAPSSADVVEVEAGLLLGMGEAQTQVAGGDPADQLGALLRRRRVLDQRAAEHDRLQIGFERQRLAELLHHDHRLDRRRRRSRRPPRRRARRAAPSRRTRARAFR